MRLIKKKGKLRLFIKINKGKQPQSYLFLDKCQLDVFLRIIYIALIFYIVAVLLDNGIDGHCKCIVYLINNLVCAA